MHLIKNIKLEGALFEVRTVLVRDQLEQEFSFRFESIVQGHYVYRGALNKPLHAISRVSNGGWDPIFSFFY